ncbi:MAG TPA: WG repeat-containing protein [Flavobacteriales bacterium]|nr:WG repeat-containing protein [Flavobacteriales bacterium]
MATDNGYCVYIDKSGKEISQTHCGCQPFNNGLAMVTIFNDQHYKVGYIDKTGKEIIPKEYDFAEQPFDGLIKIGKYASGKLKLSGKRMYGYF